MTGKIIIAGGSGSLGKALARYWVARGCEIVVLSRSEIQAQDSKPKESGGMIFHRHWTGMPTQGADEWEEELRGASAVINLAGRSVNCRYTARNRRQIMESRVQSTRALAMTLKRCSVPPKIWLNSSTATIYRHSLDRPNDEWTGITGPSKEGQDAFSLEVAQAWEEEFFKAEIPPGVRRIAMRTAIVLSGQPGNVVEILRRLARMGLGGPMGSGRQMVSWIHELDFCRAVEFLMEHDDLSGLVNVAAPKPVRNEEMMRIFRGVCGRRIGLPAARWMLEAGAFLLRTETELILKSRFVVPGKLVSKGFTFKFPTFQGALENLVQEPRVVSRAVSV